MVHLSSLGAQFVHLEKLIEHQSNGQLKPDAYKAMLKSIKGYLQEPEVDEYKLEVVASKIINLGADYEAFVSALVFKTLPDQFTRKELVQLEEELYHYIEKEVYGKGLDKVIAAKLEQHTIMMNPEISESLAKKKALGNWGWLIPHALTQIVVEFILRQINDAILEAKKGNRKGKIRLKKV